MISVSHGDNHDFNLRIADANGGRGGAAHHVWDLGSLAVYAPKATSRFVRMGRKISLQSWEDLQAFIEDQDRPRRWRAPRSGFCGRAPRRPRGDETVPSRDGQGIFSNIPSCLCKLHQWVCWTTVTRDDENIAKVPINPRTGNPARVSDPQSWASYDHAVAQLERDTHLRGIGFVFSAEDPYTGIDIDDCRDPVTGIIADWAQEIIRALDSYTGNIAQWHWRKNNRRGHKPRTRDSAKQNRDLQSLAVLLRLPVSIWMALHLPLKQDSTNSPSSTQPSSVPHRR